MRLWSNFLSNQICWISDSLKDATSFYCVVATLFVLGALLVANTPTISFCGGNEYTRRRSLTYIGSFAMVMAVFALFLVGYTNATFVHRLDPDALAALAVAKESPMSAGADESSSSLTSTTLKGSDPGGHVPSSTSLPPRFQMASTIPYSATPPSEHVSSYADVSISNRADRIAALLKEATDFFEHRKYTAALEDAARLVEVDPDNAEAYLLRGNIYARQKNWVDAQADFQHAIHLKGASAGASFNLAELQFLQRNYDAARAGFLPLEKTTMGDFASFKVFLCDLFGGRNEEASRDLAAFNVVGSNPSYYFSNAAWALYHHQTDDARGWLDSASRIYSPTKYALYTSSLTDLGYLPLPKPVVSDMASLH